MPNTSTASWPALVAGQTARASDVESKFDWSEFNLWPHSGGTKATNVYDLGDTDASWRYMWLGSAINPTSTANPVTIGTTTSAQASSTAFEVAGARAMIVPRMTTTQRDLLTGVNGMLIYNSTTNQFQVYQNGGWQVMGSGIIGLNFIRAVTNNTVNSDAINVSTNGRIKTVSVLDVGGALRFHTWTVDSITTSEGTVSAGGVESNYIGILLQNTSAAASATMTVGIIASATAGGFVPININTTDIYFDTTFRIQHRGAAGGTGTLTSFIIYESA